MRTLWYRLPRNYDEASRAVDVGRWAKGRHVTEVFDELGPERLLASTPTDDLAESSRTPSGPLAEHEHSHCADLVQTLGVWLDTRNIAREAAQVAERADEATLRDVGEGGVLEPFGGPLGVSAS